MDRNRTVVDAVIPLLLSHYKSAQRSLKLDPYKNVLQGSHASWKVPESAGFLSKIFGTCKVLENEFGPGKSRNFPVV